MMMTIIKRTQCKCYKNTLMNKKTILRNVTNIMVLKESITPFTMTVHLTVQKIDKYSSKN